MRAVNQCLDCRYWSEMLAKCDGGGPVQAVCLNPRSKNHQLWTVDRVTCERWADACKGRVDDPAGDPYTEAP
jgi:hypothetical protein